MKTLCVCMVQTIVGSVSVPSDRELYRMLAKHRILAEQFITHNITRSRDG